LLTPGGVGAIAVVRLRGARAWAMVRDCVMPRKNALPELPEVGRAYLATFRDAADPIDDVVIAVRRDPTAGENWVDVSCHGGRRIIERILLALQRSGARVVQAFTQATPEDWPQAIANLATDCLTRATTRRGSLFLLDQARRLPADLRGIISQAEAGDVSAARRRLGRLLADSVGANRFHEPAQIVLVGPPNVGKSLLANRLSGCEGALVADLAGTTRDWVAIHTAIAGVPLTIIDTAGHHATPDALERAAVEAGARRAASADVLVYVADVREEAAVGAVCGASSEQRPPDLVVLNKLDLASGDRGAVPAGRAVPAIRTSARTGEGMEALGAAILGLLNIAVVPPVDPPAAVFDRALRERLAAHLRRPPAPPAAEAEAIIAAIRGRFGSVEAE